MTDNDKYPSVILSMYGYRHLPVRKSLFVKQDWEKEKLKRIKAAHKAKMQEFNREHSSWNKDYIVFSNSLNKIGRN